MKKVGILLLSFLIGLTVDAKKISEQTALQRVQKFMPGKHFVLEEFGRTRQTDSQNAAYYIFNAEDNAGFVIVAGDDRMTEILGYSDRGNLNIENAPDNLKWLLGCYEKVSESLSDTSMPQTTRAERDPITPFITTEWGQDYPYNSMCPIIGTSRSVTGCVATAMAQVINYCQWPQEKTKAVPAYTTESEKIKVPALDATQFYWDYLGSNQIARLMRYCGQAIKMDYGPSASGGVPTNVPSALKDIFGYDSGVKIISDADYSSDKWEKIIYEEISAKRPVILSGMDSFVGGHTFIVHGYENGLFRINWGWEGQVDGYFALTNLASGRGDYSLYQSAVIGIQPPGGIINNPTAKVSVTSVEENYRPYYLKKRTDNTFPSFSVKECFSNVSNNAVSLLLGVGLYGDDGLISVWKGQQHTFNVNEAYETTLNIDFPKNLAEGEYSIVPVCQEADSEKWLPAIGSTKYYIKAILTSNLLKLQSYPLYSDELREEYGTHTIDDITYELYNQLGNYRATVVPAIGKNYSGNMIIPKSVSYNEISFDVFNAIDLAFQDCAGLTSLSTSMTYGPSIINCAQLTKVEYREETILFEYDTKITNCPALKEIIYKSPNQITFAKVPDFSESTLPALSDVYFYSSKAPAITRTGNNVNSKATFHIPAGSISSYQNSAFKNCKLVEDLAVQFGGIQWSYCLNDKTTLDFAQGHDPYNKNVEFAIHVPKEMMQPYKNQKINAVQFFTPIDTGPDVPDYVFITKPGVDYLVKQKAKGLSNAWTDVQLPEPLTITGEELYVGVGQSGSFCVYFTDPDVREMDGIWMRKMDRNNPKGSEKWSNQAERFPNWAHPIGVRFIISGEELPNDIKIANVQGSGSEANPQLKATIVNMSPENVQSYTLSWTIDGKTNGSKTFNTTLLPNSNEKVSFDIPASVGSTRSHTVKFEVTEINGKPDGVPANNDAYEFTFPFTTNYSRKMVMEEVSGTWCGWSARALETMTQMKKLYPDNFLSIAIHVDGDNMAGTDPMGNVKNYDKISGKFDSWPNCLMSRLSYKDPNLPEIKQFVIENKDNAIANISASAYFKSDKLSDVIVNTETTFGFNDQISDKYRIAYVVVEDQVGPYKQSNAYSGQPQMQAPDDYLNVWVSKPESVEMKYDNIARGIFPHVNGAEGSIPNSIKKGEVCSYQYTLPLPSNIKNKKNIHIIALLMDSSTGEIMNAYDTYVSDSPSTAIRENIITEQTSYDIYDIQGRMVRHQTANFDGLPKGLYIIDGKKVVIK